MLEEWVEDNRKRIYSFLSREFPLGENRVADAARYVVVNDRSHFWRPLVVLASAKAYGIAEEDAMPYAAAIEVLHTATLILDDLPSMDDAELRRGKKTIHREYDVATAELCFFDLISDGALFIPKGRFDVKKNLRLVAEYFKTSKKLIEGQEKDLFELEKGGVSLSGLIYVNDLKSGSPFAYSAFVGGFLGNASENEQRTLTSFGTDLGVAYQIKDDIADVVGEKEEMGKPTGKDKRKITIVDVVGEEGSRDLLEAYTGGVRHHLAQLRDNGRDVSFLEGLVGLILED